MHRFKSYDQNKIGNISFVFWPDFDPKITNLEEGIPMSPQSSSLHFLSPQNGGKIQFWVLIFPLPPLPQPIPYSLCVSIEQQFSLLLVKIFNLNSIYWVYLANFVIFYSEILNNALQPWKIVSLMWREAVKIYPLVTPPTTPPKAWSKYMA